MVFQVSWHHCNCTVSDHFVDAYKTVAHLFVSYQEIPDASNNSSCWNICTLLVSFDCLHGRPIPVGVRNRASVGLCESIHHLCHFFFKNGFHH